MKKILAACAAILVGFASLANDSSKESLLQLFNARLSENPRRFAEAARDVAEAAADGQVLHQFAIALVAGDLDFPADVADTLTPEMLEAYRRNRSKIELATRPDRSKGRTEGNPFACYLLSLDTTNATERLNWLQKAVRGNNEQALNELAAVKINAAREALTEAYEELRVLHERNASEEEIKAARQKCNGCRNRLHGARKEAAGYFTRAVDKGDVNANFNLGFALLYGYGCARNEDRALGYIKVAAKDGHPYALALLGECYRDGIGGPVDLVGAASLFLKSAELGHVQGLYDYGRALLYGQGVDRNEKLAVDYLRRAARKHLVEAMDLYAECLMNDIGAEEISLKELMGDALTQARLTNERARAARQKEAVAWWYHCATERQYAPSMEHLGVCFLEGRGVEKRETAGVYWIYRAAMDYAQVSAMERMADCCARGLGGLEESRADAHWWKTRARAHEGDRQATIWLKAHDPNRFDQLRLKAQVTTSDAQS